MKAAVLDFDGVIAHSIEQHAEAYRRTFAPLDVPVSDRDIFLREGARSESIIEDLLRTHEVAFDAALVDRLGDEKQRVFRDLGTPRLYPQATAMVRRIRACADKMGLVTGTRFENLELMIGDLLPLFDVVLAQDAYSHDKPHPEPYLTAADRLHLPVADCVGLENAVRGVRSAKAAGYGRVIAIATTMEPEALAEAGADAVVMDHDAAAEAVCGALQGGP